MSGRLGSPHVRLWFDHLKSDFLGSDCIRSSRLNSPQVRLYLIYLIASRAIFLSTRLHCVSACTSFSFMHLLWFSFGFIPTIACLLLFRGCLCDLPNDFIACLFSFYISLWRLCLHLISPDGVPAFIPWITFLSANSCHFTSLRVCFHWPSFHFFNFVRSYVSLHCM